MTYNLHEFIFYVDDFLNIFFDVEDIERGCVALESPRPFIGGPLSTLCLTRGYILFTASSNEIFCKYLIKGQLLKVTSLPRSSLAWSSGIFFHHMLCHAFQLLRWFTRLATTPAMASRMAWAGFPVRSSNSRQRGLMTSSQRSLAH